MASAYSNFIFAKNDDTCIGFLYRREILLPGSDVVFATGSPTGRRAHERRACCCTWHARLLLAKISVQRTKRDSAPLGRTALQPAPAAGDVADPVAFSNEIGFWTVVTFLSTCYSVPWNFAQIRSGYSWPPGHLRFGVYRPNPCCIFGIICQYRILKLWTMCQRALANATNDEKKKTCGCKNKTKITQINIKTL